MELRMRGGFDDRNGFFGGWRYVTWPEHTISEVVVFYDLRLPSEEIEQIRDAGAAAIRRTRSRPDRKIGTP